MERPLDPIGVRILGALIEKEYTTPDNYPLTLNALTAACNQTSNRDPVMQLDEGAVKRSLDDLARQKLVRAVHRGDSRALRYRQELSDTLRLHQPELAALCVLLLRGPQTPGEIRTRGARIFEFVDPRHVEITLEALMTLEPPLVVRLSRRPGQKEVRYTHLLAGEPMSDVVEEVEAPPVTSGEGSSAAGAITRLPGTTQRIEALEDEVRALRSEVGALRAQLDAFRRQFE
jgi:uncharacterized protein YceH (UPF0502 family)